MIILFDRVDNLTVRAEVKQSGVVIGQVKALRLVEKGVLVNINLEGDKKIPIDSKFSINSPLVGATYVVVEPSTQKKYLASGDTVTGLYNQKGLLDDIVSDSVKRERVLMVFDTIATQLRKLLNAKKDSTGIK